jgi:hypothetical protein
MLDTVAYIVYYKGDHKNQLFHFRTNWKSWFYQYLRPMASAFETSCFSLAGGHRDRTQAQKRKFL